MNAERLHSLIRHCLDAAAASHVEAACADWHTDGQRHAIECRHQAEQRIFEDLQAFVPPGCSWHDGLRAVLCALIGEESDHARTHG